MDCLIVCVVLCILPFVTPRGPQVEGRLKQAENWMETMSED